MGKDIRSFKKKDMYKVLFVSLILLSAWDIKATDADTGMDKSNQLNEGVVLAAVSTLNTAASPNAKKCVNRFDMGGYQVDQNCNRCVMGTHESGGKCVSNNVGCKKKTLGNRTIKIKAGGYATITGNCVKCNFWQWTTVSDAQGNYCTNRWWMWVIIFVSGIIGLALLVSAISFFACCDDCCSKKQSSKSSKGRGGEVNVENKKPGDKKKKESSGCCGCGGGDKDKKKKEKKVESYDRGYEKPGVCDCMCCANVCGGCFGACGCTCSKCCRKKDRYVSGYGLGSSSKF